MCFFKAEGATAVSLSSLIIYSIVLAFIYSADALVQSNIQAGIRWTPGMAGDKGLAQGPHCDIPLLVMEFESLTFRKEILGYPELCREVSTHVRVL